MNKESKRNIKIKEALFDDGCIISAPFHYSKYLLKYTRPRLQIHQVKKIFAKKCRFSNMQSRHCTVCLMDGWLYTVKIYQNVPSNFFLKTGSWVATPTGQVFKWHFRIMVHPMTINGAVENPNSSAPKSAATTTSKPVRIWPSAWRTTRDLRSFRVKTWWVSATPSSQGRPAPLIPVHEDAPVPPSCPEKVRKVKV